MANLSISPMGLLAAFIFGINCLGFLLMGIDKIKAARHTWRIPELTAFIISLAGGSLGIWLAMWAFRHKTNKYKFLIGIPLIFVLETGLLIWILTSPLKVIFQ